MDFIFEAYHQPNNKNCELKHQLPKTFVIDTYAVLAQVSCLTSVLKFFSAMPLLLSQSQKTSLFEGKSGLLPVPTNAATRLSIVYEFDRYLISLTPPLIAVSYTSRKSPGLVIKYTLKPVSYATSSV